MRLLVLDQRFMVAIVNRVDGVDGYANELEGFVFSKEVFEDRSGVKWSGLYCLEATVN